MQFTGRRKKGGTSGIMAIDDFRVSDNVCSPMGNCDFEQGDFCSWSLEKIGLDWVIGSGHSSKFNTGPKVDHTTKTNGG